MILVLLLACEVSWTSRSVDLPAPGACVSTLQVLDRPGVAACAPGQRAIVSGDPTHPLLFCQCPETP
jgi:hypothetical protein